MTLSGGSVTLQDGSVDTDAGAWQIDAPATLVLNAGRTFAATGSIGGDGALSVSSGTTTVPDAATLNPATLNANGGTLNLNGTAPATTLPQVNLAGGTLGGTRNRTIGTLAAHGLYLDMPAWGHHAFEVLTAP